MMKQLSKKEWEEHWAKQKEKNRVFNLEAQRTYRKKHKDDLLKARRVSTALMRTRSHTWRGQEVGVAATAKALIEFLPGEKLKELISQLKKIRAKKTK